MAPKWIGFLFFIWVMAALVGSVVEGSNLLENASSMNIAQNITSYKESWAETDVGPIRMPSPNPAFFGSIYKMMTLDFPIFDGGWELVRWIVLGPIAATIVYGLVSGFFGIFRKTV